MSVSSYVFDSFDFVNIKLPLPLLGAHAAVSRHSNPAFPKAVPQAPAWREVLRRALEPVRVVRLLPRFCRIKQLLSKNGVDFIEQFLLEIA